MSTTIRVSEAARDRLATLAASTGRSMADLAEQAIDALERQVFFEQLARGYEALRADPVTWSGVESERDLEAGAPPDTSG